MPIQQENVEETLFFSQLLKQTSAIELLKQVLMHSHHAVVITDADRNNGYRIVYANKKFCTHTGYELAELVGNSPAILQGPKSNKRVIAKLSAALERDGFFYGSSINYRKDGSMYPVEWNISAVCNEQGVATHYISMQKDLTNLRRLAEQIQESTTVFKRFYFNATHNQAFVGPEARRFRSKGKSTPDAIELFDETLTELKKNEKLLNGNLRSEAAEELFEDAFFDMGPDDLGAFSSKQQKGPESAEGFWLECPIEEDDVACLLEAVDEVDAEVGLIQANGYSQQRIELIIKLYKELANSLYFCVEFNDGALIIDEVAVCLTQHLSDSDIPIEMLVMFNKDLFVWIKEVFDAKQCDNIYNGETNTIAAGRQLIAMLN
ncbi:PAS domain S-box protein [Pseudoalteromonas sp. J010]|uniref:PAS domain-containing protein n=1 Tax=Pseudoalteromonas sp. J010 TaxID=998465 RepID=UPI000F647AD7|nr:PAS domain-containing protein [Pseudoalteromonas sp. J010]RRS07602.1 PAS domain S-box protein [Pseudoalteromonas sp. J010]